MSLKIMDLPVQERPRERLYKLGAESLSLRELIEVVLVQGNSKEPVSVISQNLLSKYGNLGGLQEASVQDLCQINGIGLAKAIQIKAVFELGSRFQLENDQPKSDSILTSLQAYKLSLYYLRNKKKEHLLLFCLDVHGKLVADPKVLSIGVLDSSLIHPREIFHCAIKYCAARILLAHNHPSGSSQPSEPDIQVTAQIFSASLIMGIQLVDHIIIGHNQYCSIREAKPGIFVLPNAQVS